jgi:carotenoid 1,2-hydratase
VAPDGYAWWYVDGVSDDGRQSVSVIGFIGSVFSPYYRWAGRRRPHDHCAINVALYGRGGRWAMTERGAGAVSQSADRFEVGPSAMEWTADGLTIEIDEIAVPHLSRLRGRIRVSPTAVTGVEARLDPAGAHVWRPFAPAARIEVAIDRPGWRWSGHGYFDANFGTRALEADFADWTWARLPLGGGAATIYDAGRRDGSRLALALAFDAAGRAEPFAPPAPAPLPRSFWGLRRRIPADPGARPTQALAMLDVPFYTRSMVRTRIGGTETLGVHEHLDLDRFAMTALKPLLALRMPRRAGPRPRA